ncbi:MAG: FkbM family methyltransferase [Sphingopyxis sp.]|uniref:FkbM family methyltransferase n=1 Tax=Sphingopyxis sp. TaxID=1908224 RepID=UPI0032EC108B
MIYRRCANDEFQKKYRWITPLLSEHHAFPERRMPMSAEGDVDLLVHDRFFRCLRSGTMLEIGAARPDWLSIGAHFRGLGWDVLSVEPNPHFAALHRNAGHDVAEVALASADCDSAIFTIVDCGGQIYRNGQVSYESFSSLGFRGKFAELSIPDRRQQICVRVCRADTLLNEARPDWKHIDLITVDIEGWEIEALSGLDFERYQPRVVILENLFAESAPRSFMRERGYVLWRSRFPNEIFARAEELSVNERVAACVYTAFSTFFRRLRIGTARLYRNRKCRKRSRGDRL